MDFNVVNLLCFEGWFEKNFHGLENKLGAFLFSRDGFYKNRVEKNEKKGLMMSKKEEMKDGFCQKMRMFVNIYISD